MIIDLGAGLAAYLASRRANEDRRVDTALAAMTPRERQLVREVAVMAAVRAVMRAGVRYRPAADDAVVRDAISACLHMDDLYPTVARLERLGNRREARR